MLGAQGAIRSEFNVRDFYILEIEAVRNVVESRLGELQAREAQSYSHTTLPLADLRTLFDYFNNCLHNHATVYRNSLAWAMRLTARYMPWHFIFCALIKLRKSDGEGYRA